MTAINSNRAIDKSFLLIAIGNSRIHCAWLKNNRIGSIWDVKHISKEADLKQILADLPDAMSARQKSTDIVAVIASVVPQQAELWRHYSNARFLTLKNIGLRNIYSTLGIDRALAVWGGGETYGYPCLVIDGGTALTFTGVNQHQELVGGAILPGLRSQFTTLKQKTAALPQVDLPKSLPLRWATDTEKAIASGIIHTTIAGIYSYVTDWQKQYSSSSIILTGGDGEILTQYLWQQYPELKSSLKSDRNLIFYGMKLAIVE